MSAEMNNSGIDLDAAWDLLDDQEERVPLLTAGEVHAAVTLAHWLAAHDDGEAGELAAAFVTQIAGRLAVPG
ncbi:hypothetical protein [Streptomyces sp. NPDC059009]|uniref:hypothetical protein n=1 Tax=Streptomyces sp. NPDC059009 TaxID=3346694 RepID=UPI00367F948E